MPVAENSTPAHQFSSSAKEEVFGGFLTKVRLFRRKFLSGDVENALAGSDLPMKAHQAVRKSKGANL